jgi:signal transduction histidine kinase/ActR/RegA family two-component response regulator
MHRLAMPRPIENWGEPIVLLAALVATSLAIFAGPLGMRVAGYPIHYAVFPLVVWGALRFRQLGATAVLSVISVVAIWSTLNDTGPFALETTHESLIALQLYLSIIGLTGLLLGAATCERDNAARRAARDYARLADADRRKDEFLAMLAHELRNPLAPLGNAIHLLGAGDGDRSTLLATAGRQVKQLARLVDDLLDVSRITQGKITLRRERVVLSQVIDEAVESVRSAAESRGLSLAATLPPRPVLLDGDAARLKQIFSNLLSNAVKFTPAGGSIRLTAEHAADEVRIRVRDSGVGLSPELLPHVFDLFVQADVSLERASGGLGIGLTIVRRLVEMHGGSVEARSDGVGYGSEFIVRLPATLGDAAAVRTDAPRTRVAARPARVLLVEDNRDSAETLATILELWGHEVRVCLDGLAALTESARFDPHVIISDLGLPAMNGYELAARLRARPTAGKIVLIALSGYGREEDRRRALDAGFDHHLVKPPDLNALSDLLSHLAPAEPTETKRHTGLRSV